jgi:hypothetical protein
MTMYPPFSSNGSLYVQYERAMKTYGDISGNLSRKYLSVKFSSSKWLYSKNLVGHTGCVNALAFSNNGGEFLASGMYPSSLVGYLYLQQGFMLLLVHTKFYSPPNP